MSFISSLCILYRLSCVSFVSSINYHHLCCASCFASSQYFVSFLYFSSSLCFVSLLSCVFCVICVSVSLSIICVSYDFGSSKSKVLSLDLHCISADLQFMISVSRFRELSGSVSTISTTPSSASSSKRYQQRRWSCDCPVATPVATSILAIVESLGTIYLIRHY